MPDLVEDERLGSMFQTLRTEAGAEIRPPGSDNARRTVRRRRSVRMAGATVLAVAGLVAVGLVVRLGPSGPTVIGEPPPTLGLDQRDQLGVEALATLGYAPTDAASRPGLAPIRAGIVFGGVGAATQFTHQLGTPAEPLSAGLYELRAVCLGRGRVAVDWWSPPGTSAGMEIECGEDGGRAYVPVDARGLVDLTITPDADAIGRAGVAVVLTDPRLVAARAAIGIPTRAPKSGGEAVLYQPVMNVDESGTGAAGYRLLVACAGAGTVDVTFAAGTYSQWGDLACTPAGDLIELTVVAQAGASLAVTFEPDAAATGHAAVVYRVTEE